MINKKQLENLFKKFVEKDTGFSLSCISESEDKSYLVEFSNWTNNGIEMTHNFFLEKEDLQNTVSCLEAIASKIYEEWENWDADEEFQYGYENSYYKDHPIELAHILEDYDDKLKEETEFVYRKINDFLEKLEEAQEQENKDDQR